MGRENSYIQVKPVFGVTYEPGLVGFSRVAGNFVSDGISIVTGDEAISGVNVSHAFLVEDAKYCIEATGQGVVRNYLDEYFDGKHLVYFRRPQGLDQAKASLLLDAARAKMGQGYSYGGIVGMLMDKICRLGAHVPGINRCRNPFNSRSTWFCSELVSFALHCLPEYRGSSLLSTYHPSRISPQRLFESDLLEPWSLRSPRQVKDRYQELVIGQTPITA
ncbi:MAG: hypothetical protein K9K66_09975 [Desulfarculaceae bacterium]|nr:hypothetical protein [Desulfarculaceae bacterium]MCF8073736.1 hypothetical protein [Desulfarculaceae bacterium]MCF8101977.1 hypothetical protein [Desulfarculaceae bacterium]MCF8115947.1 hypothetical protein [Desulfarculaceae bacterium]